MRKELKMVEDIMKKSERAQRKEKALKKEVTEGTLKFLERGISEMTKNLNSLKNSKDIDEALKIAQSIIKNFDSKTINEFDKLDKLNEDYEFYADLNDKLNGND